MPNHDAADVVYIHPKRGKVSENKMTLLGLEAGFNLHPHAALAAAITAPSNRSDYVTMGAAALSRGSSRSIPILCGAPPQQRCISLKI